MKRDYYRQNATYPARQDRFHMHTLRVRSGRIKVTMWEIAGDSTGGPLDKQTAEFADIMDVLSLFDEIHKDLTAEGWEWDIPKRFRRTP